MLEALFERMTKGIGHISSRSPLFDILVLGQCKDRLSIQSKDKLSTQCIILDTDSVAS